MNPIETAELTRLYRDMVRIRRFEEQVADLVEAGEIKTPCHFCIGQEAAAAGACGPLRTNDLIFGAHRSHGHYLAKGGDMHALMAEIFGKATGCSGGRGGSMHVCDPEMGVSGTVPIVAATIPLAVGAALASTLKGENFVAVSFFGDGATEEGHYYESLNLAVMKQLPVIFVCENNLYSSHMALLQRRSSEGVIARSSAAVGVAAEELDGNDVEVVYAGMERAVERARSGGGPTLLELRTFRWRGHVGPSWDIDVGVKRKDELHEWMPKDPVARTRTNLLERGAAEEALAQIESSAAAEVAASLEAAREASFPEGDTVEDFVYSVA